MNKLLSFVLVSMLTIGVTYGQSIDDLKKERDEKAAQQADLQGQADALAGEVAGLSDQISKLSGWQKGLNGTLGFNFNKNNKWGSDESASSGLNVGITAFANQDKPKYFWNNKGIVVKSWQDVDANGDTTKDDLFDVSTADIVNISSLAGYKLTDKIALSGLGELNTTVENLDVGTIDIGVGATWTPIANLVVVVHPLNYHLLYSKADLEGNGALGAKIRADYTRSFPVAGKTINWSSTFTNFFPYSKAVGNEQDLNEWQWINSLNFTVFKGIGVGFGFGVRDQAFTGNGTESYTSLGLSYGF